MSKFYKGYEIRQTEGGVEIYSAPQVCIGWFLNRTDARKHINGLVGA